MKNIILFIICCLSANIVVAQTTFHIEGGNINIDQPISIVLENTNWQNDGSFQADSGTVFFVDGIAVSGQTTTTFHNLLIDNIGSDLDLSQDVTIDNQLEFINGKIRLNNFDLELESDASFSGVDEDNYVQINGNGQLIQTVGNTTLLYPIGASTFNPAYLNNNATDSRVGIAVNDTTIAKSVNRTWNVEVLNGTLDGELSLLWSDLSVATDFDATQSSIIDLNNNHQFTPNFITAQMSNDFSILDIHTRDSISQSSIFTVSSDRTTSTEVIKTIHNISIYPNPTSDYLIIESKDLVGEYVQIFDVNGRVMMEFQQQETINKVNLTDLSAGTYFVKIGNGFRKIIVQK